MSTLTKTNRSLPQQAARSGIQILLAWGVMFAVVLPAIVWGAITGDHAIWWTATTVPTGILINSQDSLAGVSRYSQLS